MSKTIGSRMIEAREAAGASIENVAKALDVHPATIERWEHDLSEPRVTDIAELCDFLQLSKSARYRLVFGEERS